MKERGCNVCGDHDQKRFFVVKRELCDVISEITGQTLVTNDRVCYAHLPKGWKEKYADRIHSPSPDVTVTATRGAPSRGNQGGPVSHSSPMGHGGGGSRRSSFPSPAFPMYPFHPLPPTGMVYRFHAHLRGSSQTIVVPADPTWFVSDLAQEIQIRYSALFPSPAKKTPKYEILNLMTSRNGSLAPTDRIVDVLDHDDDVSFELRKDGANHRGPQTPRKPRAKRATKSEQLSIEDKSSANVPESDPTIDEEEEEKESSDQEREEKGESPKEEDRDELSHHSDDEEEAVHESDDDSEAEREELRRKEKQKEKEKREREKEREKEKEREEREKKERERDNKPKKTPKKRKQEKKSSQDTPRFKKAKRSQSIET